MQLAELLATQFVLPSIPRVVALLLSELDQAEPDLRRVNQLISTDMALTARLLQWSNSSFFKMAGKINSVSEALAILGLAQVRAMAAEAAFEGWTRAALAAGGRRLELPPGEADRLFPGGPIQVLTHLSGRADLRTVEDMEKILREAY